MWAQPVYETIESNVKAYVIKRQMRSAGLAPAKEEAKLDAKVAEPHKPSPFDVGHRPGSVTHQHQAEEVHHLPPVTETVDMERGLSGASSGRSGRLSRRSTACTSGSMAILNSAPIPDLLPVGGEPVAVPALLHALPSSHLPVTLSCNRWQRTCPQRFGLPRCRVEAADPRRRLQCLPGLHGPTEGQRHRGAPQPQPQERRQPPVTPFCGAGQRGNVREAGAHDLYAVLYCQLVS